MNGASWPRPSWLAGERGIWSVPPRLKAGRRRELGVLARAGFAQDVARRAHATAPDEAKSLVIQLCR